MKKFLLIVSLLLLLPAQAFAATTVNSNSYYVSFLDQYRLDYTKISAASYQLYFVSPSNEVFTGTYNIAPTGTHYLTCNGTYHLNFFDGSGALIGETAKTVTTAIIHQTCASYADGISGLNDLNAKSSPGAGGSFDLSWDALPGATQYDIWKDGVNVGQTPGTTYNLPGEGSVSIVARDSNGNIIGRSDLIVPDTDGCDVCEKLNKLLQCPDWGDYMGELTKAIKNALPPPPDWEHIADLIGSATVRHLENYFGPVPDAPTQAEIDGQLNTNLPEVDATVPEANKLVPSVPAGYEQPRPFDITTGPQIEIKDESVPFQILDPLHNLEYDEPGVPVYPGDPRNNTGGISKPGTIQTTVPKPSIPAGQPPSDGPPRPGDFGGTVPKPGITTGKIPIPGG